MEFLSLPRATGDFQQPLTEEQIRAVAARAFGPDARVESARELPGGEYNTLYRIALAGQEPVALRVAPNPALWVPWHEEQLLRREHTIQPYFAALGPLLPQTLFVDFTRTVIERDYLFQTWMPGEQWRDIAQPLSLEEEASLWRELARVAKTIHAVEGSDFGEPYPGRHYLTWSACMLDSLKRTLRDVEHVGMDGSELSKIVSRAAAHTGALDEITRPRLLHGDLWTFNVLVARGEGEEGWHITAVLDYDRATWGDPFADWTFHMLPRRLKPEVQAIFWEEYGKPPETRNAQVRGLIYEGLHAGTVLADAGRRGDAELARIAHGILRRVVDELSAPPVA